MVMEAFSEIFANQKLQPAKLPAAGFTKKGRHWRYQTLLPTSGFLLTVTIDEAGQVLTQVIDLATQSPYTLHLQPQVRGEFAGTVKAEVTAVLQQIVAQAYADQQFQAPQTQRLIAHVQQTYGDELEFLWPKAPFTGVWRHAASQKWYGLVARLDQAKLAPTLPTKEVEILNLHATPAQVTALVNHQQYFPAWHMNKQHWLTVILNDQVADTTLFELLAASYQLANQS